ncbi:MAG: hypothetical protein WD267_03550 [Balneolales bacterium]
MNKSEHIHIEHDLIPISSPSQWKKALLGINHTFGHTWENNNAMYLTTGFPTYLYTLTCGDIRIVCPIAEREYNGFTDIVTPYGFSGFVGNYDFPELQKYWKSFAQKRGYVCGYIGLNPLWENHTYFDTNDVNKSKILYVMNLDLSTKELFNKLSTNRRRQLRKYDMSSSEFICDKKLLKEFFLNHYHSFFIEKDASQVYNFTMQTLSKIIDADNVMAVGVFKNKKIEAVSLFAHTCYGAEYLFNISVGDGKHHTVPLIWFAVEYFKSLHIPFLNLGGGVRQGDSLSQFKERFGGIEYTLKSLNQIYNEDTYEELCKGIINKFDLTNYFPPYRNPEKMTLKVSNKKNTPNQNIYVH